MTRTEAIENIVNTYAAVQQEFCVGVKEYEDSDKELVESLEAIGISKIELIEMGYAHLYESSTNP